MAIRTNLLGAGSPLLPSSAPNPTTAATDLAAVAVPLPCDSDRGIDPAAGALCLVRSNERDGLAAAGETSGGGFFPAIGGMLVMGFAAVGFSIAVSRFARWLATRSAPVPTTLPTSPNACQLDEVTKLQMRCLAQVIVGRQPCFFERVEILTELGMGAYVLGAMDQQLFDGEVLPVLRQLFPERFAS